MTLRDDIKRRAVSLRQLSFLYDRANVTVFDVRCIHKRNLRRRAVSVTFV